MPQMKPLAWLYLFIMFTLIMMITNMFNFYFFYNKNTLNNLFLNKNKLTSKWKW